MRVVTLLAILATCLAKMEVLRGDWYYRNCNSYITKNPALTSLCKHVKSSKGRRGRLSPEQMNCMCNQEDYRLSMYGCISYAANAADTKEATIKESWQYFESACASYIDKETLNYDHTKEVFYKANITQDFRQANQSRAGPFIPDEKSLPAATCKVYADSHKQRYWAQMYPLITTWYIAGIMFVQTLGHWSTFYIPVLIDHLNNSIVGRKVRSYVVLPAMFTKYRAESLKVGRWFQLVFPPRLHAVFLGGYAFLSIFFLAYDYKFVNDGEFWKNQTQYVGKYLGLRSGQLGMHKMMWLFLFAGRNNILIWLTGWQFEIFNHWHRWVSRLFAVDIIAHTIAYALAFKVRGRLPGEWSRGYMIWGMVGLVAICLLCVNGTKTLRQMGYEVFLYTHIVLAVASVIGAWYHIEGSKGMKELYAVVAFWCFDRLVRFLRIVYSNPMSHGTFKAHPDGTLVIDISYSGLWNPKAGTYIFIHFLHPLYFFQSHPFTIVPLEEKGKMRLYCKSLKGITKTMFQRAVANGGTLESRLLIEGPYGVEFSTKQFKEVVMIAGGIGITAIYSHLKEIIKKGGDQIVQVHWVMSNESPLVWFKKELDEMMSLENVNVTLYVKSGGMGSTTTGDESDKSTDFEKESLHSMGTELKGPIMNWNNFKPDLNLIINEHITNSRGNILFFVCGPASMSDATRQSVAANLFQTRHYVEFFEESFSM